METRQHIAAYDIASGQRLRAALNILLDYAVGRQKSVFECELDAARWDELQARMKELVEPAEDRFLMLPASMVRPWDTLGIAPCHDRRDFFLIE
ncbi:MAG: CRISPR-associated endonuclease Cas2 [Xanthomonadales bacterium]|nr:CRISPR-associated endonuclease Cas2 [Xanthomonadales bacterium]